MVFFPNPYHMFDSRSRGCRSAGRGCIDRKTLGSGHIIITRGMRDNQYTPAYHRENSREY
jgi:hypothetical protein